MVNNLFLRYLLIPFSVLYGLVVRLRNYGFDMGLLHSEKPSIPTICVGNLSVGGTGKTPHVEYLARFFKNQYSVAILSRGYGRKTKGFLLASASTDSMSVGDEPYQYFKKFPELTIAVCEKRVEGLRKLSCLENTPQVVLLDDAFQHRYIKPSFSILLTEYQRPYYKDCVLPSGRLREDRSGAKRADIIIVTKSPQQIDESIKKQFAQKMKLRNSQQLYFSYISYAQPVALTEKAKLLSIDLSKISSILLFTGISNPKPLQEYLKKEVQFVTSFTFADHHRFTEKELQQIRTLYQKGSSQERIIVTSEKDAARMSMKEIAFLEDLPVFFIPIEVKFNKVEANMLAEQLGNIL